MKTRIDNAMIITPDGVLSNHSLIIQGGYIEGIVPLNSLVKVQNVVDAKRNFLAPGLIDMHMHGQSGYDVMDATPEALEAIANTHLKNGVTGFLATIMSESFETMTKAIRNVADFHRNQTQRDSLSSLLGIYLEGPFFNPEKCGAQPKKHLRTPDIDLMEAYLEASSELIRVVSMAPELQGSSELVSYLENKHITSAFGHTNASYETTLNAVNKGMTLATHMFNGMKAFKHRDPGPLGVALMDDRVYSELIVDGVHLHERAVDLALKTKGPDKLILISDAMRAAGLDDGTYELAGQSVTVKNKVARLNDGSLAGSAFTLMEAVRRVIDIHKVKLHQAFNMASLNPAKALNLSEEYGSIEAGKRADFLLLDKNLDILNVFKSGHQIQ